MGRRSGTENVIGIAGFAAAAVAAQRDLEAGTWSKVEKLRKILENTIAESANKTIFVGKDANRLPNTSCFVTPGWKGETQVMVMDLAGFDQDHAGCALRVSLGPLTSETEVRAFAQAWLREHEKFRTRGR